MITPGIRLGPYEIISAIGAGGMGEVYRARDSRLDRTVAIKVLPPAVASKAEFRQRFEHEARAISSLNHPHICTLHDVGRQDDIDFLVMEYVDGETLEHRLTKGPLPVDQALRYAREIADALDNAHRQGIVHRDLKPSNVMITKSGAKLLDFGIATLKQARVRLIDGVTSTTPLTGQGSVVGTLQYMAPEQIEGKDADARTDIFALGALLYEMVTGAKAFQGSTQATLIGAILKDDPPPISQRQPLAPPALDRLVRLCLAKDPEERWQSAHDVASELHWIASLDHSASLWPANPSLTGRRRFARWAMAGLVLGAAAGAVTMWAALRERSRASPAPLHLNVTLAPQSIMMWQGRVATLSPDGTRLVFAATDEFGRQRLYLRPLDRPEVTPLDGSEEGRYPFFSPDGQWLGFFSKGTLSKVSVSGGAPIALSHASDSRGASWGPDNTIFFTPNPSAGISRVDAAGGPAHVFTTVDVNKGERSHRFPEVLPNGKAVLFTLETSDMDSFDNAQIGVQSLDTGQRSILVRGGSHAYYAPTGHLIYVRAGALMAAPFDLERLAVTGPTVPVLQGVQSDEGAGEAHFAFSQTGSLVYLPGRNTSRRATLLLIDRNGKVLPLKASGDYYQPRVSPDGRRIALTRGAADDQLWMYDLERGTLTRPTMEPGDHWQPIWTPDGKRVTFASNRAGALNIFWKAADGSGVEERLTTGQHPQYPTSWAPDGRTLLFEQQDPVSQFDIWMLRLDEQKPVPVLQTRFNELRARVSPDGRWIAYVSDESGRFEVYVQPITGGGAKVPISTEGGTEPVWNRNGRELFYLSGDRLMAVDVSAGSRFSVTRQRLLFEGGFDTVVADQSMSHQYDVTPDGHQFVMLKSDVAPATSLNVILNWFATLRGRVPIGP